MTDEDIGYLKRAVEDLTKFVRDHMEKEEKEREELLGHIRDIQGRLSTVEEQLSLAKTLVKFVKFMGYCLIAVFSWKTIDLLDIWKNIFK